MNMAQKIDHLHTALFGFTATREAMQKYQKPIFDSFELIRPFYFNLPVTNNHGVQMEVRVDARKSFYSIFTLLDFDYSKSHKNYTLSKGTRGQARTFVELPMPGQIKKSPEYIKYQADLKEWSDIRTRQTGQAIEEGLRRDLEEAFPEYEEVLQLSDDDAPAYFKSKGWDIPAGLDWKNWSPKGWIMTSRPDGYGHDCGTHAIMDWSSKTIMIAGWSSDD